MCHVDFDQMILYILTAHDSQAIESLFSDTAYTRDVAQFLVIHKGLDSVEIERQESLTIWLVQL